MTSERWQLVKELFEAASERGPAERADFLARACEGDEEVRREVESLLGSVVSAGDRVRIATRLIRGATDEHLWAEDYERDLRNVFALQGEVARAIADEIEAKVTTTERASRERAPGRHRRA